VKSRALAPLEVFECVVEKFQFHWMGLSIKGSERFSCTALVLSVSS
jgi:hypothetical protein